MLYGYVSFLLPQSAIARTGRNCSRTRSFLFGSVRCGVLAPNSNVAKTAGAFGKSRMHFIALILHGRRSFFPKRKINRQYISSNISVPIIGLVVAQWVGGSIALLFHNHGTRMGWVVSSTPRPLYPRERPGNHCTGGCVGPQGRSGRPGNLDPTGIRSPDRPARSRSLYRLSYPTHFKLKI